MSKAIIAPTLRIAGDRHEIVTLLHLLQARGDALADMVGAVDQLLLLEHVEHGHRRCNRQRVAGIGAAEAARIGGVHDLRLADHARQREAAGEALRHGDEVRLHVVMFHREHLAGAAVAGLHFVGDQHDAVLVADLAQRAHQLRRRLVEAAFALHRLDDDGGDAGRIDVGLEQEAEILQRFLDGDVELRGRERHVPDFRHGAAEALLVGEHLAGHGHGHVGAAMEAAGEGDHAGAAGRGARDLDGVLGGFGAGGEEGGLGGAVDRRQLVEALGEGRRRAHTAAPGSRCG